ncbi:MAG TPA: FtsX-like permease family protein [Bacteroidia bacterium]|nr:FtsX-like permease family protein [Bacteroidia bacterium]
MKIPMLLDIAKTLMLARLRHSVIAAVGVTFGITMFITLVSFMTGLNGMLDSLILNRTPHVRIYNNITATEIQPIEQVDSLKSSYPFISSVKPANTRVEIYNSLAIIKALKNDSRVIAVSPKINAQVFYNLGAIDLNGIINGIDINIENKHYRFNDYMIAGNSADLEKVTNSIILGKGVADKMLVNLGETIYVTNAKGDRTPLKVVGIFQLGLATVDDIQSYSSIATAQKLMGEPSSYFTDIQVKLADVAMAPQIAKEFKKRFGVDTEDIQTANAQFESGTRVRNIITYAVSVTLLIVAGFGIYNILNMMIYEKMDAIAILKATGFSGGDVSKIFMNMSMVIGILGGIGGLIFGTVFTIIIDHIPFKTAALPAIDTYPINYNPWYYVIGLVFSLATTFVAGYFPARKASRIDPVLIIRGK